MMTEPAFPATPAGLTVTQLDSPASLCLRGEADMLGVGTLRGAIAAVPADAREIHLELAALSFIDVCCTRQLLALARRSTRPRLILHQPPRGLALLLRLLGPDCHQASTPPGHGSGDSLTVSMHTAG